MTHTTEEPVGLVVGESVGESVGLVVEELVEELVGLVVGFPHTRSLHHAQGLCS